MIQGGLLGFWGIVVPAIAALLVVAVLRISRARLRRIE